MPNVKIVVGRTVTVAQLRQRLCDSVMVSRLLPLTATAPPTSDSSIAVASTMGPPGTPHSTDPASTSAPAADDAATVDTALPLAAGAASSAVNFLKARASSASLLPAAGQSAGTDVPEVSTQEAASWPVGVTTAYVPSPGDVGLAKASANRGEARARQSTGVEVDRCRWWHVCYRSALSTRAMNGLRVAGCACR